MSSVFIQMKLAKHSGKSFYLQAADYIAGYVMRNRLPAGQLLPTQKKLAQQLAANRITVRKATLLLVQHSRSVLIRLLH